MSMEEALIAAIVENPDDDAPRLIYSDWLDEHGQHERGEFIRVQCQLARLDSAIAPLRDYTRWVGGAHKGQDHLDLLTWLCALADQGEDAQLRRELRERERALLDQFSAIWTEPLRRVGLLGYPQFRRGMIESIDLDPEVLLTNADYLFRRYPVRTLWLRTYDAGIAATGAAFALSQLARLRNLELYVGGEEFPGGVGNLLRTTTSLVSLDRLAVTDAYEHFGDADLEAVANTPHFAGLRVLQLTRNSIGADGIRALAASPYLRNLEFLSLAQNPIRSAGVAALAGSANFSRLTFLDLWLTEQWSTEPYLGVQALAASPHLGQLRTLFLDRNDLGPDALVALASSPFLRSLSALDLADNQCGLEGLRALTASPLHSQLRALDLAWSVFEEGDEAAELLGNSPGSAGLRVLGLSGNEMRDRGASALASSPYLGNLWRLALHSNIFTAVGEEALTRRFQDRWRLCWADHP
jgi:uncharacterized protein (TIGR02996 family)